MPSTQINQSRPYLLWIPRRAIWRSAALIRSTGNLDPDVAILTISTDLPFAQKRWCGAAGVDKVTTLSDHRDAAFGEAYGVLIKELRLLARAVFVVDKEGIIRYIQLVKEIAEEPDYDAVISAVKELV